MAALTGFDLVTGTATVTAPFAAAQVLLTQAVPARTVIGGIDLTVTDLDTNAVPLLTLNVGDVALVTRFIAGSTIGRTGGTVEFRPVNTAWFRYNLGGSVLTAVGTDAATDAATGTVTATLYTYPGVDVSDIARATLQRMGVLAEGETPRFDDNAITIEALAETHQMLRGRNLTAKQDLSWDLQAVPLFALRPYAAIAANMLADTFGLSGQRIQLLAQRAAEGERELRRQTRVPYSGNPVSLEPYQTGVTLDYGVSI
jgi:hypothetical protein